MAALSFATPAPSSSPASWSKPNTKPMSSASASPSPTPCALRSALESATRSEDNPGMPRTGRNSALCYLRLVSLMTLLLLGGVLPAAGRTQSPAFPETAAGLKSFLQQLSEVAAFGDSAKSSAAFQELEIPNPGNWFYDLLGPDLAKRVTVAYSVNPNGRQEELQKQLATVKTREREILTSPLVASAGRPLAPLEKALVDAMKSPQLFFSAKLVDLSDNSVIPIGYFVQVTGIFRYVDIRTLES